MGDNSDRHGSEEHGPEWQIRNMLIEAIRSHRLNGEAVSKLRHELRTPINHIIGYSELLMEDAKDGGQESLLKDLQRIHAAARNLLIRLNSMLDTGSAE